MWSGFSVFHILISHLYTRNLLLNEHNLSLRFDFTSKWRYVIVKLKQMTEVFYERQMFKPFFCYHFFKSTMQV